jgi:hypothetical protein
LQHFQQQPGLALVGTLRGAEGLGESDSHPGCGSGR